MYNSNILHTARYFPGKKRATLHACVGDSRGGSVRARNILQHGLRWMREPPFAETFHGEDGEKGRLETMWKRLLMMSREADKSGKPLGFSQVG